MSYNLRSASPVSTRSASSTSSTRSVETLYGSAHTSLLAAAFAFDPAALDALDDGLLFSPGASFADACYSSLESGASPSSPKASRRSEWVQNFRFGDDDSSDDDDEGVRTAYTLRASLDEVAPWVSPADDVNRPLSVIEFRRPSATSTFGVMHDLDTSALCQTAPIRTSFVDLQQEFDLLPEPRGRATAGLAPKMRIPAPSPPPSYHSSSPPAAKKRFRLFSRRS